MSAPSSVLSTGNKATQEKFKGHCESPGKFWGPLHIFHRSVSTWGLLFAS